MSRHRTPAATPPPGELLIFDPAEWAVRGDPDWQAGWRRWRVARRSWSATHPGSLGDRIDRQGAELDAYKANLKGGA